MDDKTIYVGIFPLRISRGGEEIIGGVWHLVWPIIIWALWVAALVGGVWLLQ